MSDSGVNDLDYLATRLHSRSTGIAAGDQLNALCRLAAEPELEHAVYPDAAFGAPREFQRELAQTLARELSGFLKHLEGPGAELLEWMLVRFQLEDVKVLLRGVLRRTSLEILQEHLISLPRCVALNVEALSAAGSIEALTELLPRGPLRKNLSAAIRMYADQPSPFFYEGALDQGYFRELLARTEQLADEDRELIQPVAAQEVDTFHLMLVLRGKFQYGLPAELLLPLHVPQSGISRERFGAMLAAADPAAAASLAVGKVIDALPSESAGDTATGFDCSAVEALGWQRFLRLSNLAFRRSHMGLGAVVGYVGIRRVEIANLITLSEEMLAGLPQETRRRRLLPSLTLESAHV